MNEADAAFSALRDEALRRIGRNVLLFQELENVLKFLASVQHPSMPMSEAKATREQRAESIRIKTLGQVAGLVMQELFAASDAESIAAAEITEPWLTFSFRIAGDPADLEADRRTLKALIEERNDLVHHLLSRWDLQDAASCRALCAELEEQRSRIVLEIGKYRAYANTIREMARELQAFIDSDAGKRWLDLEFLRQSRLAAVLASTATESMRADSWTPLSTAGHRLAQLIPDEFARLKKLHGEGSLQKLVAAIGLFDLGSERTPTGGTRTLYRLRSEEIQSVDPQAPSP